MNYTAEQEAVRYHLSMDKQGTIQYISAGSVTGDPWNPSVASGTAYTLDAVATGVSQKYVDGSSVYATDLMVTSAVFDVDPDLSGTVSIDGKVHQIVKVMQTPAAGVAVAWKIICRA